MQRLWNPNLLLVTHARPGEARRLSTGPEQRRLDRPRQEDLAKRTSPVLPFVDDLPRWMLDGRQETDLVAGLEEPSGNSAPRLASDLGTVTNACSLAGQGGSC